MIKAIIIIAGNIWRIKINEVDTGLRFSGLSSTYKVVASY
jgi:hypothetical protein